MTLQLLTVKAQVAQLVEQRTENPRVGGSIPPLGTMYSKYLAACGKAVQLSVCNFGVISFA
jgi:hypothetical protein